MTESERHIDVPRVRLRPENVLCALGTVFMAFAPLWRRNGKDRTGIFSKRGPQCGREDHQEGLDCRVGADFVSCDLTVNKSLLICCRAMGLDPWRDMDSLLPLRM